MRRGERAWIIAACVGVASGCLYPSFDEVAGAADPSPDASSSGGGTSIDGGAGADGATATSSDGGGPPITSTNDGGPINTTDPRAGKISCGSATCDVASSYCCPAFGDAECKPSADAPFCQNVLHCDGAEDCTGGNVCCIPGTDNEATCRADCPSSGPLKGRVLCHTDAPKCPTGQQCTGKAVLNNAMTLTFCE